MKRAATLLLAAQLSGISGQLAAHDYYGGFFSGGAPGVGRWCCSGDLDGKTGDCSPAEDWRDQKDGSMLVRPRQYPDAWILVPAHRILPDGPPDPKAREFPVHWCGKPRPPGVAMTPDDPDPRFITICASRFPGGT